MTRVFNRSFFLKVIVTMLFVMVTLPIAFSQGELGGRLRGTVVDGQGAVVKGASVALSNPATDLKRTTTSNNQGEFVFVDVPAGTYKLSISMAGFRTANFSNVTVALNEVRSLNAKLEVGSTSETVEVTGESAAVVSQETTLRNTVDETRLEELPLNGRDFSTLVFYSPSVMRGAGGNGQGSGFNVAGARGTVNNFMIDGGDANDPDVPFGVATDVVSNGLPIDSVEEFSVITSNASAEFGRSSGGTINVTTKSGTNAFHGTLWEFHRDKSLNSRNFFDPVGQKSPFVQNQFGFIFTGPIIKNKLFFAGTYEGFRQVQSVSNVVFVPTPTFISSINTATASGALMKAILQGGFPAPTGTSTPTVGTFTTPVDNGGNQDSYFTRVDYNLNSKNQLFFDYQYSNGTEAPGSQGGTVPGTRIGLTSLNYHGVANWTDTITNNLLNTARWVFQRNVFGFPTDAPPAALLAAGSLRTNGPFAGQPFSPDTGSPNGVPTMTFGPDGFATLGASSAFPQGRASNTFQYEDTLAWVHGNHQFKFGAQLTRIQENDDFGANIRPNIAFTSAATGVINTQAQFTFLNNQPTKYFRETDFGFFAQDSWRILRRVTLDFGLRYELSMPLREKNNQVSNLMVMDPSSNRPIACKAIPLNGQLQNVAIVTPHHFGQDMYCTDKNNFAPRLGVAWDVFGDGKTVVHSSYGIFYDRIFTNALANARFSPPFTISSTIGGFNYDGRIGGTTLSPTVTIAPTTIDPAMVTPYTQRWNLSIGQQVEKNTVLNISYVGARGLKLAQNLNPNFGGGFTGADMFRPTNALNPATRSLSDITGADVTAYIVRAPFGNVNLRTTHAYSNYNGLDVSLNHRFSGGLSFLASYTWSHSLDVISDEISSGADSASAQATLNNLLAPLMTANSGCAGASRALPLNPVTANTLTAAVGCAMGNTGLSTTQAAAFFVQGFIGASPISSNYGDSAFDVRHRFSSTMVYELPFGQGKRWGSDWHGPLNQAAGGWEINTIFEAQSGSTAPLSDGYDANRDGITNDRPFLTGPLSALFVDGNGGHITDTSVTPAVIRGLAACSLTASLDSACPSLSLGQGIIDPKRRLGRGAVRGPGLWDFDFGTNKNFQLTERFGLQFRAEMFNVMNRVNFLRPSRTVISPSTFGQITGQRTINGTQSREIQFALKLKF